jgi:hypothetical protein
MTDMTSYRSTRGVLLASIAALIVTTFEVQAAPVARSQAPSPELAAADQTDFGARRRARRGGGNAAGLAMMGMMVGTIGAVIANQQRREAYERSYAGYGYYGHPQPHVHHVPHAYGHPNAHLVPYPFGNYHPDAHRRHYGPRHW